MRRSFGRPRSTGENKARWPCDGAGSQLRPGAEMAGAAEEVELGRGREAPLGSGGTAEEMQMPLDRREQGRGWVRFQVCCCLQRGQAGEVQANVKRRFGLAWA